MRSCDSDLSDAMPDRVDRLSTCLPAGDGRTSLLSGSKVSRLNGNIDTNDVTLARYGYGIVIGTCPLIT